ncbi:MAG: DUF503 domain-containing protein [Myxococcota bacterium]
MKVGVLQVVLQLGGLRSLKEKRGVLRPLLDGARARFNAGIIESAYQDDLRRAQLAAVVASTEGTHASSMLQSIADFFEERATVVDVRTEVRTAAGDDVIQDDLASWSDFS